MRPLITLERLKELLHYNPDTGIYINMVDRGRARKGNISGTKNKGYISIMLDGHMYQAHRLAWFYMTGKWPDKIIDHKDGNGLNNRFSNLRDASHSQNQFNRRKNKGTLAGFKGVSFNKKSQRWKASINFNKKTYYLGYFETPEEASEAYNKKAKELHGEFYNNL